MASKQIEEENIIMPEIIRSLQKLGGMAKRTEIKKTSTIILK